MLSLILITYNVETAVLVVRSKDTDYDCTRFLQQLICQHDVSASSHVRVSRCMDGLQLRKKMESGSTFSCRQTIRTFPLLYFTHVRHFHSFLNTYQHQSSKPRLMHPPVSYFTFEFDCVCKNKRNHESSPKRTKKVRLGMNIS